MVLAAVVKVAQITPFQTFDLQVSRRLLAGAGAFMTCALVLVVVFVAGTGPIPILGSCHATLSCRDIRVEWDPLRAWGPHFDAYAPSMLDERIREPRFCVNTRADALFRVNRRSR